MKEARDKKHILYNSIYKKFLENDIIQYEKIAVAECEARRGVRIDCKGTQRNFSDDLSFLKPDCGNCPAQPNKFTKTVYFKLMNVTV